MNFYRIWLEVTTPETRGWYMAFIWATMILFVWTN